MIMLIKTIISMIVSILLIITITIKKNYRDKVSFPRGETELRQHEAIKMMAMMMIIIMILITMMMMVIIMILIMTMMIIKMMMVIIMMIIKMIMNCCQMKKHNERKKLNHRDDVKVKTRERKYRSGK